MTRNRSLSSSPAAVASLPFPFQGREKSLLLLEEKRAVTPRGPPHGARSHENPTAPVWSESQQTHQEGMLGPSP